MSYGLPPPQKPESPPPTDYWDWFRFHVWETFQGNLGDTIGVGFILGVPSFALYAGVNGLLQGRGFIGGALYCVAPVAALAAVVVVPLVTLNMISHWVEERRSQADYRARLVNYERALADWKKARAAWEEGAPFREASARVSAKASHFVSVYYGLVAAYQERAKGAAARRAALEAQVGKMFTEYRLRNDWDASDPALVPRLQVAFRTWMQDTPPFPPEDMALLATSSNADTLALIPPPTSRIS